MAQVLGEVSWESIERRPTGVTRFWKNWCAFFRRKPLGAVCGLIVLFFVVIGDLVPEAANTLLSLVGIGSPVPYLADFLRDHLGFVYSYSEIDLRNRLEGSSAQHLLGTDQSGRDVLSRIVYG